MTATASLGPLFDICANRHGGNAQSIQANRRAAKAIQTVCIVGLLTDKPMTLDECAEAMEVAPNRISGRFTELKAAGSIEKIGTRPTRTGSPAAVWRMKI